jgi:hypothetical protein
MPESTKDYDGAARKLKGKEDWMETAIKKRI